MRFAGRKSNGESMVRSSRINKSKQALGAVYLLVYASVILA